MIDSGSPLSIFTTKGLEDVLRTDVLFARLLSQSKKYEKFNQQPLKITKFIYVQLKVGKQQIKRARTLVAVTGRSLVGRDRLAVLQYQFKTSNQIAVSEFNSIKSSHLIDGGHSGEVNSTNRNDVIGALLQLFTRQGKAIGHTIKIEFKPQMKFIQQKGRLMADPTSITRIGPQTDRTAVA